MPPIASPSTGAWPAKAKAARADRSNKRGCPERAALIFILNTREGVPWKLASTPEWQCPLHIGRAGHAGPYTFYDTLLPPEDVGPASGHQPRSGSTPSSVQTFCIRLHTLTVCDPAKRRPTARFLLSSSSEPLSPGRDTAEVTS